MKQKTNPNISRDKMPFDDLPEDMASGKNIEMLKIYINNEYVGDKFIMEELKDEIRELDTYLKEEGFENYTISNKGNKINIIVEGNQTYDFKSSMSGFLDVN